MDFDSWTHDDDVTLMTFNKSFSYIVPFWNDTDLFREVISDLWINIMHVCLLTNLSRSMRTAVRKAREALPKNKTNRKIKAFTDGVCEAF